MHVTDKFIFIHLPKTGGSFVSSALEKIYKSPGRPTHFLDRVAYKGKNKIKQLFKREFSVEFNQHGSCRQIPIKYKHLPIVSCMRLPYDWYVSNYKFAWWKSHPETYPDLINDSRWPNLSFKDYLELSSTKWLRTTPSKSLSNSSIPINTTLGRLTILFIDYYCKNPDQILSLNGPTDYLVERIKEDMYPVKFLDTNKLNQELYDFLLSNAYSSSKINFILNKPKIKPGNNREERDKWENYIDEKLKCEIRERDRILFEIFPMYDI